MSRAITPAQVLESLGSDTEGLKALGSAALRVSRALEAGTVPDLHNLRLASGAEVQDLPAFAQGTLRNLARNLSDLREIDTIMANQGPIIASHAPATAHVPATESRKK